MGNKCKKMGNKFKNKIKRRFQHVAHDKHGKQLLNK